MKEMITTNIFFGITLTLVAYNIGLWVKQKFNYAIFNPLLISIILVVSVLILGDIDYSHYQKGGQFISFLLTPTTVALAIPLYENLMILKKDYKAILAGIISGVFTSAFTILPLVLFFQLDKVDYATLLPKSITSAIGMVLSQQFGGLAPLTVVIIILTGIFGALICERIFKLFKITQPIAQGVALGSSSHAVGTAKAFSLGEIQGAIASLALAVSGIITALLMSFFIGLY